nr:hypothetical protein L203_03149 [Cryptococcus depauperatus CBS 7841]
MVLHRHSLKAGLQRKRVARINSAADAATIDASFPSFPFSNAKSGSSASGTPAIPVAPPQRDYPRPPQRGTAPPGIGSGVHIPSSKSQQVQAQNARPMMSSAKQRPSSVDVVIARYRRSGSRSASRSASPMPSAGPLPPKQGQGPSGAQRSFPPNKNKRPGSADVQASQLKRPKSAIGFGRRPESPMLQGQPFTNESLVHWRRESRSQRSRRKAPSLFLIINLIPPADSLQRKRVARINSAADAATIDASFPSFPFSNAKSGSSASGNPAIPVAPPQRGYPRPPQRGTAPPGIGSGVHFPSSKSQQVQAQNARPIMFSAKQRPSSVDVVIARYRRSGSRSASRSASPMPSAGPLPPKQGQSPSGVQRSFPPNKNKRPGSADIQASQLKRPKSAIGFGRRPESPMLQGQQIRR